MPLRYAGEGAVILGLEVGDDLEGESGLGGDFCVSSFVVLAVPNLFAHETVRIMSVVWRFCEMLIVPEVTSPSQVRPYEASNCCVHVSRLHGVEVFGVMEDVPDAGADAVGLSGFGVELGEFETGVGDEY